MRVFQIWEQAHWGGTTFRLKTFNMTASMVPLVLLDCSSCRWIWSIDHPLYVFIVNCVLWWLIVVFLDEFTDLSLLSFPLSLVFSLCPSSDLLSVSAVLLIIVFFSPFFLPPCVSFLQPLFSSFFPLLIYNVFVHLLLSPLPSYPIPHLAPYSPSYFHPFILLFSCPLFHLPFSSPPQPPPLPAPSLCREARHCRANPCWIPTTLVHTCTHKHTHSHTVHTHNLQRCFRQRFDVWRGFGVACSWNCNWTNYPYKWNCMKNALHLLAVFTKTQTIIAV